MTEPHLFDGKPKTEEEKAELAEIMLAGKLAMDLWLTPRLARFPTAEERDLVARIFRVDPDKL